MPPRRGGPSQATRLPRRRIQEEEEEHEEHEEHEEGDSEEATCGGKQSGSSDKDVKVQAAQVVRYALFMEYKRKPISRTDITKQTFPQSTLSFNTIFDTAQKSLRSVFGMELVELPAKSKGDGQGMVNGYGQTQTQGQTQVQSQRKGNGRGRGDEEEDGEDEDEQDDQPLLKKAPGSKTYILRSILPARLLGAMSEPRPLPRDPDDRDDEETIPDSGALTRWEKSDGTGSGNVALLGIRTLVLSLVMCMGRVISDDHLHALLRRLNLNRETILPYSSKDSKEPHMTLDRYLDLLAKQGYLDKIKVPAPNRLEEGASFEWRWGTRPMVEFSEKAAAAFIQQVFEDEESDNEAEDDQRRRRRTNGGVRDKRAEREAKKQKLTNDLVKAVGGPLMGSL